MEEDDLHKLCNDISNMITSLSDFQQHFQRTTGSTSCLTDSGLRVISPCVWMVW
mgnify:CR=1 FL=1